MIINCEHKQELAFLLRECGKLQLIAQGKLVHLKILRYGQDQETFLGNLLVQMYGLCGNTKDATRTFEFITDKNVFSWNLMVAAFTKNGDLDIAWEFFQKAPVKDAVSWTTMLVGFAQKGSIQQAKRLFDRIPRKDLVAWNAMLAAYSQNGETRETIFLFRRMSLEGVRPNDLTLVIVLDACVTDTSLHAEAKLIQRSMQNSEILRSLKPGNALINLYARNKHVEAAMEVFEDMVERDVISWTCMISAFNQSGLNKQALSFFRRMELEGIKATSVSLIEVLNSCACTASVSQGREIHRRAVSAGWFHSEIEVRNAVLNMYGKCGDLVRARAIFDEHRRDLISWNTMIVSYAQNGAGREALKVLEMMGLEGVEPDGVTVLSVISACSHGGIFEQGLSWALSMLEDYGVEERTEQWNCVADLLGRLGYVEEAKKFIAGGEEVGLRTLLGACKVQGDLKLSTDVSAGEIVVAPPSFVLLSNLWAFPSKA